MLKLQAVGLDVQDFVESGVEVIHLLLEFGNQPWQGKWTHIFITSGR